MNINLSHENIQEAYRVLRKLLDLSRKIKDKDIDRPTKLELSQEMM